MADSMQATPRKGWLPGKLSDFIQSADQFARKPFGYDNPPAAYLSDFLGVPQIARTLDRYSYGEPLTTGRGMTTQMRPDTADALLAVAPAVAKWPKQAAGAAMGIMGAADTGIGKAAFVGGAKFNPSDLSHRVALDIHQHGGDATKAAVSMRNKAYDLLAKETDSADAEAADLMARAKWIESKKTVQQYQDVAPTTNANAIQQPQNQLNKSSPTIVNSKPISPDSYDKERLWFRYGLPPEDGISRHVQHGREEAGISVMSSFDDLGNSGWSPSMITSMTTGEMGTRPLYVVSGKQIKAGGMSIDGLGSDGEPLIHGAKVVRLATPEERYRMVADMDRVAREQFGYSEIPGLYKLLNSEKP